MLINYNTVKHQVIKHFNVVLC